MHALTASLILLAACQLDTSPEDPCGAGADACWDEPTWNRPDAITFAAMDNACAWLPTAQARYAEQAGGAVYEPTDLLVPRQPCRDLIDANVPWGASLPAGSKVRATVVDALWVLFYAPMARAEDGVFLGALDLPVDADALLPVVATPGVTFGDPQHPWVNEALRDTFYDTVSLVRFVDTQPAGGVLARYSGGTMTVYGTFNGHTLQPDGTVRWFPSGERFAAAAVLHHESVHGLGDAHDHAYCPTEQPGVDHPGCDADVDLGPYASEATVLDAMVHGIVLAGHQLGAPLVAPARLETPLDAACLSAKRVTPWAYGPTCAWFGDAMVDDYVAAWD